MKRRELKLIVSGSGGVGKSAIIIKKITGHFVTEYDPTIEDDYRQLMEVNGEQVLLDILDSGSNEDYSVYREQWMRKSDGFIIVYSITDHYSFEQLYFFHEYILRFRDEDNDKEHVPIIIVGNKIDLENDRQVTIEEGEQLADELGADFVECSAKEDINITEIFENVITNIIGNSSSPSVKSTSRTKGCLIC